MKGGHKIYITNPYEADRLTRNIQTSISCYYLQNYLQKHITLSLTIIPLCVVYIIYQFRTNSIV